MIISNAGHLSPYRNSEELAEEKILPFLSLRDKHGQRTHAGEAKQQIDYKRRSKAVKALAFKCLAPNFLVDAIRIDPPLHRFAKAGLHAGLQSCR